MEPAKDTDLVVLLSNTLALACAKTGNQRVWVRLERAEEEGSPSAAGVAGTTALYAGDLIVATAGRPRSRSGHVAILCDDCERQEMELVRYV